MAMTSEFAVEYIEQCGVLEVANTWYVSALTAQDAEDYTARCAPFFKRIVKTTRRGEGAQRPPWKRK